MVDDDFKVPDGLLQVAEQLKMHIDQNIALIELEVNAIIHQRVENERQIEHLLERLLDYAGMCDEGFELFKRLCRYYYKINPHVVAEYVYIYRDLYDSPETDDDETEAYSRTSQSS